MGLEGIPLGLLHQLFVVVGLNNVVTTKTYINFDEMDVGIGSLKISIALVS